MSLPLYPEREPIAVEAPVPPHIEAALSRFGGAPPIGARERSAVA
jgi:hypothetical protein